MDTTDNLSPAEKFDIISDYGTGYRAHSGPLFAANNERIFKPFVRLGVYSFDEEELCHRT